jgi:predicted transglutaminase-like cysteine proteinase
MLARVAASCAALFLFLLPPAFGGPTPAFAQYALAPLTEAAPADPFGGHVVSVTNGEVLTKWNGVVDNIRAENDVLTRCRNGAEPCPAAARKFLAVIADGRAHAGRARFGVINRAINLAIQPTSDLVQWGVPDRWSAPLETLTSGRGDCEDYAIAKYVALERAGVSADDLRLVIVRDLALGQDHAIVAARLDGKWIVLDNRRFLLLEDAEMQRVLPLFVLDHDGVRQFTPTTLAALHAAPAQMTTAPAALGLP